MGVTSIALCLSRLWFFETFNVNLRTREAVAAPLDVWARAAESMEVTPAQVGVWAHSSAGGAKEAAAIACRLHGEPAARLSRLIIASLPAPNGPACRCAATAPGGRTRSGFPSSPRSDDGNLRRPPGAPAVLRASCSFGACSLSASPRHVGWCLRRPQDIMFDLMTPNPTPPPPRTSCLTS
jgi:hypothetical protein